MKRYDVIFMIFLAGMAAFARGAEEPPDNPFGFHYDAEQRRFFFDGRKTFTIDRSTLDAGKARVEVSVDDGPFVPFSAPLDFKQEGRHALKYRVLNALSHVVFQKELTFYLDTSPPESSLRKPATVREVEGVHYFAEPDGVALSSYDGLSGVRHVEINVDGRGFTVYRDQPLLEPGRHTIQYRATDHVGNVEPTRTFAYFLSSEPPRTNLQVEPPAVERDGDAYVAVGSLISFRNDNTGIPVREILVSVDDARFVYSRPFRVGGRGKHVVRFWAVDAAGNVETARTFRFLTDDTPPVTVARMEGRTLDVANVKFVGRDFRLALAATDVESGVSRIEYRLDGKDGKWRPYVEPLRLDSDGPHTVLYRAVDGVGNPEGIRKISVVADTTPPKSAFSPAIPFTRLEGKVFSAFPNALLFRAEDDLSGVEAVSVSVNGGEPRPAAEGIPLQNAAENRITYRAVDRLGNEEEPRELVVHLARSDVEVKFLSQGRSPAPPARKPAAERQRKGDQP